MEVLVSENNSLIERVRSLEKEKNDYYHQLRRMSRVSFGGGENTNPTNINPNTSNCSGAAGKSRHRKESRVKQIE